MAGFGFSHRELLDLLSYNPETGIFVWVNPPPSKPYLLGKEAGSQTAQGYIEIRVKGLGYRASRLAWFYMTGQEPKGEVDHENRVKTDNRWLNLRDLTPSENQHNRGFSGVVWMTGKRHWRVGLKVKGQYTYVGSFKCFGSAVKARNRAKRVLHPSAPFQKVGHPDVGSNLGV